MERLIYDSFLLSGVDRRTRRNSVPYPPKGGIRVTEERIRQNKYNQGLLPKVTLAA